MRTVTVVPGAFASLARQAGGNSATGTCSNTMAFIDLPFLKGWFSDSQEMWLCHFP